MQVTAIPGDDEELQPIQFRIGSRDYRVQEILDRWPGNEATYFKCLADDGNLYILARKADASWELAAFRDSVKLP